MERSDKENEEFEKYRQRVHGTEEEDNGKVHIPWARLIFAIIMVIIYVGVGILLLINFFGWAEDYNILRYVIGPVLIIYGIFRGYRLYAGIDRTMP
jgi:cytoskeletal protein RodZ